MQQKAKKNINIKFFLLILLVFLLSSLLFTVWKTTTNESKKRERASRYIKIYTNTQSKLTKFEWKKIYTRCDVRESLQLREREKFSCVCVFVCISRERKHFYINKKIIVRLYSIFLLHTTIFEHLYDDKKNLLRSYMNSITFISFLLLQGAFFTYGRQRRMLSMCGKETTRVSLARSHASGKSERERTGKEWRRYSFPLCATALLLLLLPTLTHIKIKEIFTITIIRSRSSLSCFLCVCVIFAR